MSLCSPFPCSCGVVLPALIRHFLWFSRPGGVLDLWLLSVLKLMKHTTSASASGPFLFSLLCMRTLCKHLKQFQAISIISLVAAAKNGLTAGQLSVNKTQMCIFTARNLPLCLFFLFFFTNLKIQTWKKKRLYADPCSLITLEQPEFMDLQLFFSCLFSWWCLFSATKILVHTYINADCTVALQTSPRPVQNLWANFPHPFFPVSIPPYWITSCHCEALKAKRNKFNKHFDWEKSI